MADFIKKTYLDYEGLQLWDSLIKSYITAKDAEVDARSLKTASISGHTLYLYREAEPVGNATPAYSIELPETDLSGVIAKFSEFTTGHAVKIGADGGLVDTGVAFEDLATKSYVQSEVATQVSQATHMKREIVEELPDIATADPYTFYMIKKDEVTGTDKFEVWLAIDGTWQLVDDTSVDLSGYMSAAEIEAAIATAKQEAIDDATAAAAQDAQSKVDTAKGEILGVIDEKVDGINDAIDAVQDNVDTLSTQVTENRSDIDSNTDRITALESSLGEGLVRITEAQIRALFEEPTDNTTPGGEGSTD